MGAVGAVLRSSAAPRQPRPNCPPSRLREGDIASAFAGAVAMAEGSAESPASEQRDETRASEIKYTMTVAEANLKLSLPLARGRAIRSHRGGLSATTMCCEARPYTARARCTALRTPIFHAKHIPSVSSANLSEGQALPAL